MKDANNMGAAMAPAAADTIYNYLTDFDVAPDSFDAIVTGDLGIYGSNLMKEMLAEKGYDLRGVAGTAASRFSVRIRIPIWEAAAVPAAPRCSTGFC